MRHRVGVVSVHPFYGPSDRLLSGRAVGREGLLSMAAYLVFWGAALVLAKRELDRRWPRRPRGVAADPAMEVLRERFARGEVDEAQFRAMAGVLTASRGGAW